MPEASNGDESVPKKPRKRQGGKRVSPWVRPAPSWLGSPRLSSNTDAHLPDSETDEAMKSPKPAKRPKFASQGNELGELLDDSSYSADSGRPISERMADSTFVSKTLAELKSPSITSERKQFLLEAISSDRFLKTYRKRSMLLGEMIREQVDQILLASNPIPECVSKFFHKIFLGMQSTSPSKTRALNLLFQQLNESLSDGADQHAAALTETIRSNELSINFHGAYLVFMLRLASLRQLERNEFDKFDTLCYLIETLRQYIITDLASVISLVANEEQFADAVKETQTAQVQLALSMSKHDLSLPNSTRS